MAVDRRMPTRFHQNFVFVQAGVLDAGNFTGAAEVENLREHSHHEAQRFVSYLSRRGFRPEADIAEEAAKLCNDIAEKFPQATFFAGQLVFKDESMITRWLHNHTVFELQRRLYQNGHPVLIVPIQV